MHWHIKNSAEVLFFSVRNILNEESYGKDNYLNTGINYAYGRISPEVPVLHCLVQET